MGRSRAAARDAGTKFEREQAEYLQATLGGNIERRARNGAKDRGDIGGVFTAAGARVVIECKNTARMALPGWIREAETERLNDGAAIGVVAFKKVGDANPAHQYIAMTTETFARLLNGATS